MDKKQIVLSFLLVGGMISCHNDDGLVAVPEGNYTYGIVKTCQASVRRKQCCFSK